MMITDYKGDPYLRLLRPLVEAYLAFYRVSSRQIESMGVTPSQFDVIAELGDGDGLTCAQLCKETLITKGTLTGVLDRLVSKGVVQRERVGGDRRAIRVRLTDAGKALFKNIFPAHADFLRPYFKNALSREEVLMMTKALRSLRDSFEPPGSGTHFPVDRKRKKAKNSTLG